MIRIITGESDSRSVSHLLGELARATTAYYEATPDRVETAREDYERALHSFKEGTSSSLAGIKVAATDAALGSD